MFEMNPFESVPEEADRVRTACFAQLPTAMPNPVSWSFRNFDWNFGDTPPDTSSYSNDIRQFTAGAEPTATTSLYAQNTTVPGKRKSLEPGEPLRPTKQFISERKMIEHLNGLHLSSEFTSHQSINPVDFDEMEENQPHTVFMSPTDLEQKLKNAQKITICEEVRKIAEDPLLPKALLERAAVPPPYCSALVLWQPPTNMLKVPFDREKKREEDSEPQPSTSAASSMEAEALFDNNNSSNVDYNNLDSMDYDL